MKRDDILLFLKDHKQEMKERFGVVKIGLFGSYARGEERQDSDIDLAIELKNNTVDGYFGLLHYLEDALQKPIDLGIESNIKPILKPYISKEIMYV